MRTRPLPRGGTDFALTSEQLTLGDQIAERVGRLPRFC